MRCGQQYPALVTLKVRAGLPSLRRRELIRRLERSLATLRARGDFRIVEYSIQSNHVHFILKAEDAKGLGRCGAVLRDRNHLRILRTPREVRNALAYVLLNVRKHRAQRGLATPACADSASWVVGSADGWTTYSWRAIRQWSALREVGSCASAGCAGDGSHSQRRPADRPA